MLTQVSEGGVENDFLKYCKVNSLKFEKWLNQLPPVRQDEIARILFERFKEEFEKRRLKGFSY